MCPLRVVTTHDRGVIVEAYFMPELDISNWDHPEICPKSVSVRNTSGNLPDDTVGAL
jgi:hypothetical protein